MTRLWLHVLQVNDDIVIVPICCLYKLLLPLSHYNRPTGSLKSTLKGRFEKPTKQLQWDGATEEV